MVASVKNALQRATPESQGIASSSILQFVEAVDRQIHEFHSFMLLRHGKVVAEGWWSPYGQEHPHMLFSLSKSFTSTAIGLAVAEKRFSVEDKVLSFFPDEAPAEISDHLAAMQVHHLLSMATGHAEDTVPAMVEQADGDWIKGFLAVPVQYAPGTHFLYNTGATFMLSAILQKVTGMKLIDYLEPRLFAPLGIQHATWEESPQRINVGGWGLNIKTEDIARFGQLYLQNGQWEGQQIVPADWIKEATSSQISNENNSSIDWQQGYGYQFWRCRHNAYRGDGAFGQYCIVMPEQDAVLAITSGLGDMQAPLNLVWDILLPALKAAPLLDDRTAHAKLSEKLASLSLPPLQGKTSSSIISKVAGRTYEFDANELQVQSITVNFNETGGTFTIKTATRNESIPYSYGTWQTGQTAWFNELPFFDPMKIVACGAWTAENTLTLVIRLYETPFFHTLVCQFEEATLTIETKVNVSFQPITPLVLVGCTR